MGEALPLGAAPSWIEALRAARQLGLQKSLWNPSDSEHGNYLPSSDRWGICRA